MRFKYTITQGGWILLLQNAVHEIRPFNSEDEERCFIDVIFRQIKPMPYSGIFHYHENIELIYCKSGKLKITFIAGNIILDEGDFIFINANVPHSTDPYLGENEHYCIKFDSVILDVKTSRPIPSAQHFLSLLSDHIVFRHSEDSEQMHYLFKRCCDNFTHDNYTKRLILQTSIMEIMAYIFDKSLKNASTSDDVISNEILFKTAAFIDENFSTVTLEEAAKNASMSYCYFSRMFKKEFHTSFSNYVTKIRVKKSLYLLSNTSMSITEIAMYCGFSNLSHFIKCFKQEKGITPNQFRSLVKNK